MAVPSAIRIRIQLISVLIALLWRSIDRNLSHFKETGTSSASCQWCGELSAARLKRLCTAAMSLPIRCTLWKLWRQRRRTHNKMDALQITHKNNKIVMNHCYNTNKSKATIITTINNSNNIMVVPRALIAGDGPASEGSVFKSFLAQYDKARNLLIGSSFEAIFQGGFPLKKSL